MRIGNYKINLFWLPINTACVVLMLPFYLAGVIEDALYEHVWRHMPGSIEKVKDDA